MVWPVAMFVQLKLSANCFLINGDDMKLRIWNLRSHPNEMLFLGKDFNAVYFNNLGELYSIGYSPNNPNFYLTIGNAKNILDMPSGMGDAIAMLFTGFKDNLAGNDIYDGSIFGELNPQTGKDEVIGIVKWDNNLASFVVDKVNGGWEYLHEYNKVGRYIIGNKFENPELFQKIEKK